MVASTAMARRQALPKSERMVWRQDLTPAQLLSIDMKNMDGAWNDQFKVAASQAKRKRITHNRLTQSAVEDSADAPVEDETVETESLCPVVITEDSRTNLYLTIYGYVEGLYPSEYYPEGGCTRCEKIALPFSQMAYGLGNVLNLFSDLVSDDSFAGASATERL